MEALSACLYVLGKIFMRRKALHVSVECVQMGLFRGVFFFPCSFFDLSCSCLIKAVVFPCGFPQQPEHVQDYANTHWHIHLVTSVSHPHGGLRLSMGVCRGCFTTLFRAFPELCAA